MGERGKVRLFHEYIHNNIRGGLFSRIGIYIATVFTFTQATLWAKSQNYAHAIEIVAVTSVPNMCIHSTFISPYICPFIHVCIIVSFQFKSFNRLLACGGGEQGRI